MIRLAPLLLVALLPLAAVADGNDRRTTTAETDFARSYPVSFRSERGGRFEPERLVILTAAGAWAAELPRHAAGVRQGDHLDLSGVPLVGRYFRERTAPQDAEREGLSVGGLGRLGDTLVLDARGHRVPLSGVGLTLTSELPRLGTLAFDLPPLDWRPAEAPLQAGTRVGEGYLLGGRLVLAADGQRPPVTGF